MCSICMINFKKNAKLIIKILTTKSKPLSKPAN